MQDDCVGDDSAACGPKRRRKADFPPLLDHATSAVTIARPGKRPSLSIMQKMKYFKEFDLMKADPSVAYPEKDALCCSDPSHATHL